jgi:hypothetical protein
MKTGTILSIEVASNGFILKISWPANPQYITTNVYKTKQELLQYLKESLT